MRFHIVIFIIAIVWYVITAFFSTGYYHADEHYQIIEFAGILDGSNTPEDLAWEYNAQIRPSLQVVACHFIFNICDYLSIASPYSKALILRLITSLLSVFAIYYFSNSCKTLIHDNFWKLFVILSYFIWFLPFINVRFSSETWSGIAFIFALSYVIRGSKSYQTYAAIGCLLGLSFLFRYQMALVGLGCLLWLIFFRKDAVPKIVLILVSGFVMVLIGFMIDSWFYGDWTYTMWNYFTVNLIEGKASTFGTSPWYFYIFYVFRYSYFPIGIIILLSFFFLILRKHNSIIVWTILPFLFVHSIIPHKELRFLFPFVNLVPIIIVTAIQEVSLTNKWLKYSNKYIRILLMLLLIINTTGLVLASIKPAGVGRPGMIQSVQETDDERPLNVFYTNNNNPFSPWGLSTNFYKMRNLNFIKIDASKESIPNYKTNENNVLIINIKDQKDMKIQHLIERMNLTEKCNSIPGYMTPFLKIYGYNTRNILVLYSNK